MITLWDVFPGTMTRSNKPRINNFLAAILEPERQVNLKPVVWVGSGEVRGFHYLQTESGSLYAIAGYGELMQLDIRSLEPLKIWNLGRQITAMVVDAKNPYTIIVGSNRGELSLVHLNH